MLLNYLESFIKYMKKYFLFVSSFFLLGLEVKAETPSPSIELIIKWRDPSDTLFVQMLREDPEVCCHFSFRTLKSDSFVSEVMSKDGISVGTIYGKINSNFLKKITPSLQETILGIRRTRGFFNDQEIKMESFK